MEVKEVVRALQRQKRSRRDQEEARKKAAAARVKRFAQKVAKKKPATLRHTVEVTFTGKEIDQLFAVIAADTENAIGIRLGIKPERFWVEAGDRVRKWLHDAVMEKVKRASEKGE